jgi:hypothetical protein
MYPMTNAHYNPAYDRGDRRGSRREGNDEVDHSGEEARDHNTGYRGGLFV